jgi:hypothetical protein
MERLKRITDERGISIFDVGDVVALLAHQRKEAFEGERAIRLFQFRAWILCPGTNEANAAKWAALIAVVKYLDRMEEDYFADEESERLYREDRPTGIDLTHKPPQTTWRIETLGKNNRTYREIYDRLIARRGGLLALLDAPSPADFDRAIHMQFDRMHIISDLIDYRLRYIQHRSDNQKVAAEPNGANHNHALFFCWWPTREVKSGRGKTPPNKSVSIKTMSKWWKKFERSALFIYLIQKHGFHQLPMDTDDDSFVDDLLRESNDTSELLRFLGAYAYLVETFRKAESDLFYVSVPDSIPRIAISTPPFSKAELETIRQYDGNYLEMAE